MLISFLAILFYSCIYFSNKCSLNTVKNYSDSLYFSVITFSTLGYGDILPQTSRLRLICGSEALLGIMCTGMFVAGFANKSKY
ncbi:potassium channel family protein [Clostridium ljungdahlii]|uniref:potassium channel family protein n=1 Tax=Clostridium ljungdahlii TaxID=1538 RepID=UPI00386520F4